MKTIKPINNNGSILLRFTVAGKRYSFSTGGRYDDPIALGNAELLCKRISLDIAEGSFNGVDRYRPGKGGDNAIGAKRATPNATLLSDLIQDWNLSTPWLKSNTKVEQASLLRAVIKHHPETLVTQLNLWQQTCIHSYSLSTGLRYWNLTLRAFRWSIKHRDTDRAILDGLNDFPRPKKQVAKQEVKPFTREEQIKISSFLRENNGLRDSVLFEFLVKTGCRPGEALGLQWGDIGDNTVHFRRSIAKDGSINEGLKTQRERVITPPKSALELLEALRASTNPSPASWVFSSSTQTPLNWSNWRGRVYSRALKALGIEYRNPYQTRHTYATRAIQAGVNLEVLSQQIGNSPDMLHKHYAGNVSATPMVEL